MPLAPNIGFLLNKYFSWSPLWKIVAAISVKIDLIHVHQWESTEEKQRMGWVGLWHHFRNNMFLLQSRYRMQERCVVGGCRNTESIPLIWYLYLNKTRPEAWKRPKKRANQRKTKAREPWRISSPLLHKNLEIFLTYIYSSLFLMESWTLSR